MDKDAFERELIPTVLLALDGVRFAIESLETVSSLLKAAALCKLLTKITRYSLFAEFCCPMCPPELAVSVMHSINSWLFL